MSNFTNPTISGKVLAVGDTKTFPSGFSVREAVIETGNQFPNPIPVRFTKDRTALLDNIKPGDAVSVEYRLSGREYNGRYFSDVQGLRIHAAMPQSAEPSTAEVEAAFAQDDDNIPF